MITAGTAELITKLVGEHGEAVELALCSTVTAGLVIKIPPFHAHTFVFKNATVDQPAEMICFLSAAFDKDDMVPCKLRD